MMPQYSREDIDISDSVNLLISILVRYPEIATIRFDSNKKMMKLTFMVSEPMAESVFTQLRQTILESIDVYQMLQGTADSATDIKMAVYDGVTVITLYRDINTFSKGEIAMTITLLRDHCREKLIIDRNDAVPEEELVMQEQMIDSMLEQVKGVQSVTSFVGIREDGRVLVFNK